MTPVSIPDITDAFSVLLTSLTSVVTFAKTHGFYFYGVFYSYFNITLAGLAMATILHNLPVFRDQEEDDDD